MASRMSRSKTKKESIGNRIKGILLSSQGLPIVLSLVVITVLFVLFRMKGIELNYEIANVKKEVERVKIEGKELKAKKARLLSVSNLRKMARRYNLAQPKQHQIIVVPTKK